VSKGLDKPEGPEAPNVDARRSYPNLGEIKQQITKAYNTVNQELYGLGVRTLRVDVVGNKILIVAHHERIRGLAALDRTNRAATRAMDVALLDENKRLLHKELDGMLPVKVKTVLKDYDPFTELSGTIIVTEEPLTEG